MILKLGLIIPFLASFLKPIHRNMEKQYLVGVFDSPYLYIDELENYYIDLSEFEYYFYDNYLIADTYETIDLINDQNVFTIVINLDNLSGYSLVNNDFDFYNVSFDVGRTFINSIINEAKCLNENARKKINLSIKQALKIYEQKQSSKKSSQNVILNGSVLEKMTSSDYYIKNYNNNYDSYTDKNGWIIRDDITNLIPLDCFKYAGEYFYVGSEYGFYVYTYQHPTLSYQRISETILFDINTKLPNLSDSLNAFSYNLKVVVNECYTSIYRDDLNENFWMSIRGNPNYDYAIYASNVETNKYLSDFNFAFSMESLTSRNYGESGYVLESDEADFIQGYTIKAQPLYLSKNTQPTFYNAVRLIATLVKLISPETKPVMTFASLVSTLIQRVDMNYNHYNPKYFYGEPFVDNKTLGIYGEQVELYSGLIRNVLITPTYNLGDYVLYGQMDKNDYIEYTIHFCRAAKTLAPETMQLSQILEARLVEDNTYYSIFGGLKGSVDYITTLSAERILGSFGG